MVRNRKKKTQSKIDESKYRCNKTENCSKNRKYQLTSHNIDSTICLKYFEWFRCLHICIVLFFTAMRFCVSNVLWPFFKLFHKRMLKHHLLKPVGDSHHDVERAQKEDKVEVGVGVDGSFLFIIYHVLTRTSFFLIVFLWKTQWLFQGGWNISEETKCDHFMLVTLSYVWFPAGGSVNTLLFHSDYLVSH